MESRAVEYSHNGKLFHGEFNITKEKVPTGLVIHDWSGLNDFAKEMAKKVAQQGYNSLAVDMYGNGEVGTTKEEKGALMGPLKEDRGELRSRISGALSWVKQQKEVAPDQTAALGFCFGGQCALDLGRSGAETKGVISFHGLLDKPNLSCEMKSKVLVLHGHNDPMVPPEQVSGFAEEMEGYGADWQLHSYGNTVHSFTNPQANAPSFGTVYSETAANRAWQSTFMFLEEIFS